MNKMCEKSQEIVDSCKKKLEALGNKLESQRATLRNLRRMAAELAPDYESAQIPTDLPPEYQKQLNNTLHEIDLITKELTRGNTATPRKAKKVRNMI